jgi:hypothetical protein
MIRILDFRNQNMVRHIVTPEFELYGCYLAGTPFLWDITGLLWLDHV